MRGNLLDFVLFEAKVLNLVLLVRYPFDS